MSSESANEMITVPKAEWERLLKLEADLPAMLEAVEKRTAKERFKQLQQSDTPEKVRQRVNKHYQLHKDEINAKRREKRRLARAAVGTAGTTVDTLTA